MMLALADKHHLQFMWQRWSRS